MSEETKVDLFHPAQPNIPGVMPAVVESVATESDAEVVPPPAWQKIPRSKFAISLLLGLLTLGGITSGLAVVWLMHRDTSAGSDTVVQSNIDLTPHHESSSAPSGKVPLGPGPVAKTDELTKAWSSRRFDFRNPATSEVAPALVVRLPGGELWGISLREPYGDCNMDYVTDLRALRQQYGFAASHPMVVDPCKGTIFDLGIYGNGPNGMVRGEIVSGTAVRPPVAIKMERHGTDIVAVRSE